MAKPILCLDFDGVIHAYTSGWKGADVIPDPPVPGAMDFLDKAVEHFTVAVYSSRSKEPAGLIAMAAWLRIALLKWAEEEARADEIFNRIEWPTAKPAAFLTIDDRALTFDGDWAHYDAATLLAFKPWNK